MSEQKRKPTEEGTSMKILLRHIKRSIVFRLLYRLVCWINYPTPRERMWHMYALGKAQGFKEALKTLPIVQVQPKQETEPLKVHLRPGEWSRQWRETHTAHRATIPSQPLRTRKLEPSIDVKHMTPAEIAITKVDTKKNLLADITEEMPAVVKLLHEKRQEARNAG